MHIICTTSALGLQYVLINLFIIIIIIIIRTITFRYLLMPSVMQLFKGT